MKYTGNVPDTPMGKGTPARDPEDWRKYTGAGGDAVRFVDEPLPDPTIGTKCQKLLDQLGLRYGAFDFIETPDGEMVFLEVNSNGQYFWIEKQLGMPISETIAAELISIASNER